MFVTDLHAEKQVVFTGCEGDDGPSSLPKRTEQLQKEPPGLGDVILHIQIISKNVINSDIAE